MKTYTSSQLITEGCRVGIFLTKNTTDLTEPPHFHDFIELVYIVSGRMTHFVDQTEYKMQAGDMLFINYESTHAFSSDEPFTFFNISFSPEVVSQSVITPDNALALLSLTTFEEMRHEKNGGLISFHGKECTEIENILSAMMEEHEKQLPACSRVLESYISILITKMLRKTQLGIHVQETNDIWQELSEYIDKHLGEELTLSALANKCFYNPSYFSRIFKQKFHVSLTEYVNQKRVEHAIRLLRETNLPVEEISLQCGFSDRSTFYAVFSKVTGQKPSYYRTAAPQGADRS